MCWKYSWLNKAKFLILNTGWKNFPFGGEQRFTAENHGLRFTGLLTSSRQINSEDFFNWFWLTSPAQFFLAGFKTRISSLAIAAIAIKIPSLPAWWGVQRTSACIFLLISAPGNYFPYPAVLTSFPFSATCTQKAKIQSQGEYTGCFTSQDNTFNTLFWVWKRRQDNHLLEWAFWMRQTSVTLFSLVQRRQRLRGVQEGQERPMI